MKKKLWWLSLFVAPLLLLGGPGQVRTIILAFDYPAAEVANVELFKFYATNNVAAPVSTWPVFTNLAPSTMSSTTTGTNTTFLFTLPTLTNRMFFFCTASNIAGESLPSPTVAVPYPPAAPPTFRIQ